MVHSKQDFCRHGHLWIYALWGIAFHLRLSSRLVLYIAAGL